MSRKLLFLAMQQKQPSILIAIFVMGTVLLHFPIIDLLGADRFIFGIPVLLMYFFAVILILIALVFWASKTGKE